MRRFSLAAALLAGCAHQATPVDQALADYQRSPEHAACMRYIVSEDLCRYPAPTPATMANGAAWGALTGTVDRTMPPEPATYLAVPCACYGGRGVTFYGP